jgi:hypothetical protein
LQTDAAVATASVQTAGAHTVVEAANWQSVCWPSQEAPQTPLPPQAVRPGAAAPVTSEQVPSLPGSAHEEQDPSQAELQHTPSTQKPEAQSVASLQATPRPMMGTQAP